MVIDLRSEGSPTYCTTSVFGSNSGRSIASYLYLYFEESYWNGSAFYRIQRWKASCFIFVFVFLRSPKVDGQLLHICICFFEKSHCILSDPRVDDQLLPLFSQTITTAACAATWRTKQSQCDILFVLWIVSQIFGKVFYTLAVRTFSVGGGGNSGNIDRKSSLKSAYFHIFTSLGLLTPTHP